MKARLLAFALAVVVVACGGVAGSDPSPVPLTSVTITKASHQQTVVAHVGDRIQIALGEDINWQLDPPDGTVLAREPLPNYLLVRGTQAIWIARSAGRSTISASGGMNCPSGSACPMLLAVFTATVEVRP